jgi:cell division transport system permease protein
MARSLRPAGADDLGLRRALADRLLPLLVAAMTFLAALALAGAMAAASVSAHWRGGAASLVTVVVPNPGGAAAGGGNRAGAVARVLTAAPGVAAARLLSRGEIDDLLKPWLGGDIAPYALPLPAIFEVRLRDGAAGAGLAAPGALDASLVQAADGTKVERHGAWLRQLLALADSLRACADLALLVVGLVAAAVIAVTTRAGLAARRDAIDIVHGLGATDGMIAGQFAGRMTVLAGCGSVLGLLVVLPVLLGLAQLAAPFQAAPAVEAPAGLLAALPAALWGQAAALPVLAALIGWLTAQLTVRNWLRRLP